MYGKAGAPVKEAILTARDRVLARYPKLRVVGCHLGSDEDDLDRLAKRLDAYPNFAVDTAARVRYFARGDRDQVRQFLTRYQDRILYATDFSLREGDPAAARGLCRPPTIATGPFSRAATRWNTTASRRRGPGPSGWGSSEDLPRECTPLAARNRP